ncbi:MAG: RHS repeat protein [Clostridia bacterium]|nr:RHS repeat protein [Clostridia bacterium]
MIEYDESGRVVSISGEDSGGSINITYSYNNDRYDSAETDYYVQTDVSEYHYNEEGKLIRVEQEDGNIEYDYDEHGNVTGIKNEVIGNMELQIEYEPATYAQYQAFLAIMNCNLDFVTPNEKITSFYRGFLMN